MSVTISSKDKFQKASSYCAEYLTVYNAFGTPPGDTEAGYQDTLVSSLVSNNFFSRLDLLYIFANNNEANSLINWADPGTFNADNPTATLFTAWEGFTGNGSSGDPDYISTNYIASTNGINFVLDSATFGVYIRNDAQHDSEVLGSSIVTRFIVRNSGNVATANVNTSLSNQTYSGATDSRGLWIATRRGATDIEMYRNGGPIDTELDQSELVSASEIHILKRNGSSNGTAYQVAIFFVMNGITDGEASTINTIFETYMDAIGKGVQA